MRGHFMDKFWLQVDKGQPDECWLWRGEIWRGYGRFWLDRKRVRAHRYAYETAYGTKVPQGFYVLHSCDMPPCCNPSHLFVGTAKDNTQDMIRKGRSSVVGVTHKWLGGATKLTAATVTEMRASDETNRTWARRLGLSESTISRARRGRAWRAI